MPSFSQSFSNAFSVNVGLPASNIKPRGMLLIDPMPINSENLVFSNVAASDQPEYSVTATYGVGSIVQSANMLYRSLVSENQGKPLSDVAAWQVTGVTNRYKMFDTKLFSQTVNEELVSVIVTATQRCDSIVFVNIQAASVEITVKNDAGVVVSYAEQSLLTRPNDVSWYNWFFSNLEYKNYLHIGGLAIFPGYSVEVSIIGSNVAVGGLVIGRSIDIGDVEVGASMRLRDFSINVEDEFGNIELQQGGFAKSGNFTLWMDSSRYDSVYRSFERFRSRYCVWVGPELYETMIVAGIYEDFELIAAYYGTSVCNLKLKGFI